MEMGGGAHANSVALCLYLIRASQRGSGDSEFIFLWQIFTQKIQSQNMYKNILSKIP
jgi:hypothetical protein